MSEVFVIKRGDTSPSIAYIPDQTIVFTSASAVFNAWDVDGNVVLSRQAASITTLDSDTVLQYDWAASDTTNLTQISKCEFEVTYADAKVETFPNDDYIGLYISPDIA